MRTRATVVTFILCLGVSCSKDPTTETADNSGDPSTETSDNSGDPTTEQPEPQLEPYQQIPVANCNMPSYELINPAELGEVVLSEEIPGMDITKDTIDLYLQLGGITWTGVHDANVVQFRYTTQDRGQKVEATALLAYPKGEAIPEPIPLAIFPAATLGFSDPCTASPRFELQVAAAAFASQGFVAVFPDYIGLTGMGEPSTQIHPYLIAEPAAIASWDALRAGEKLFASLNTGSTTSKKTILTGASQGAQSALFAERYGYYYAPDYEVAGIVAFAPPTDMLAQATNAVSGWTHNSFYHSAMLIAMNEWYGLNFDLSQIFSNDPPLNLADNALNLFYNPEVCAVDDTLFEELDSLEKTFHPDWVSTILTSGVDSVEPWACPFYENSLHKTSIPANRTVPTLMLYGEADPIVPPNTMMPSYNDLCSEGQLLEHRMCQGAGHSDTIYWSLGEAIEWAHARIDGLPVEADVCSPQEAHCCSGSDPEICTP